MRMEKVAYHLLKSETTLNDCGTFKLVRLTTQKSILVPISLLRYLTISNLICVTNWLPLTCKQNSFLGYRSVLCVLLRLLSR